MQTADHTNFVTVLSEEKPVMVFFYHKSEDAQVSKIKQDLKSIKNSLPLLPLYEYVIDQSEENEFLAETIGVKKTPIMMFFKNGNFHRFKDKKFTKASIMQFIGHSKPYKEPEENKEEIA